MSTEMIAKARAGDEDAFRDLVTPYARELRVHCYRMLASLDDAEDALQDTLISAWKALPQFQERSSFRTWLYRIATSRCLNALRATKRRPAKQWDVPHIVPPQPSRLGEVAWLEPYPDSLLTRAIEPPPGPEAKYEQSESVSLAFVTALQILPARQRAVLILRDVLGYHAEEVASMLGFSLDAVNSLLKRARASVQSRSAGVAERIPPPAAMSPEERKVADSFAHALQLGNVQELIQMLTDDVRLAMPPIPLEYLGRDAVGRFYDVLMAHGPRYHLLETRANGQLAFGSYLRSPSSVHQGNGLVVLSLTGSKIAGITRFEASVLPWFGLPPTIER